MTQQWEFCIISTPPPGPVEVYVSYMTPQGMERHTYKAESWDDGTYRILPQILSKMGREGWQIQFVDRTGAYYMQRPLSDVDGSDT